MAFSFFQTYQRPILFGAGIFALVTFSITAEISTVGARLFAKPQPMPSVLIGDRRVEILPEDRVVAQSIQNVLIEGVGVALPPIDRQDGIEILAAYRRIAIELGFGLSSKEAEKAMRQTAKLLQAESDSLESIAVQRLRQRSEYEWRQAVAEGLRIGNVMRIESLAVAPGDSDMAKTIVDDIEKLTLQVAQLDKKALEEEIRNAEPSDEDLQAWLDGLEGAQQVPFTGQSRASLRLFGLELAKFDPEAFATELEGKEFGDAEVSARYELDKSQLYRVPAPEKTDDETSDTSPKDGGAPEDGEPKDTPQDTGSSGGDDGTKKGNGGHGGARSDSQDPTSKPADQNPSATTQDTGADGDGEDAGEGSQGETEEQEPQGPTFIPLDDELKASIRKRLQAEVVLRAIWDDVQKAQFAFLEDLILAREDAQRALQEKRTASEEAEASLDSGEGTQEQLDAARTAFEAAEQSFEEADAALDDARAAFDVRGVFEKAVEGRRDAFVVAETEGEPKSAQDLRELPTIGSWPRAFVSTTMEKAGDMSTALESNKEFVFVYKVTEAIPRPLKPLDEIRDRVLEAYVRAEADKRATESRETYEEALLRLGKEKNAEKVAELENQVSTRVDEAMNDWRKDLEDSRAELEKLLAKVPSERSRAWRSYKHRINEIDASLADTDSKRKELETTAREEVEAEIEELAKESASEVMIEAAKAANFVVREIGPMRRDASSMPRFNDREDKSAVFLFRSHVSDMKVGDSTDVLEDFANRLIVHAVCADLAPGTMLDLTRRELLAARGRANQRVSAAVSQSFSLDAIRERWGWRRPGEDAESATIGAADGESGTGDEPKDAGDK